MPLEFYLALLQLHIAVMGVVIAGIVALVQLLNNSRPRRDIRLLAKPWVLALYGLLLAGLLGVLAVGSWASSFPASAQKALGDWSVRFFADGGVALATISLSLLTLVCFAYFAMKARILLDSKAYLGKYVTHLPPAHVYAYLTAVYDETISKDTIPHDPFQPIREYIKDNAFNYYDYGTADGLKHFSRLFDKSLHGLGKRSKPEAYARLGCYISESCEEFFGIFSKTSSEKRKLDTIALLYEKGDLLLKSGSAAALLYVVRGLENIAKLSDDDEEIIAAITSIQRLCDSYLSAHAKAAWQEVSATFDEICLSVTRISETYYLQKNNSLKSVPIIGFYTGGYRTVTAALVAFFSSYCDLGDRYVDTLPAYYFEAIESVIEVLFLRLADIIDSGKQYIGFNVKYHDLVRELYDIYYLFGVDAVEHGKLDLLTLALSNLRRIIKPAKIFKLEKEHAALAESFVELAVLGVNKFGDAPIKSGGRTISMYAAESLGKHATNAQIRQAIAAVEEKIGAKEIGKDAAKTLLAHLRTVK